MRSLIRYFALDLTADKAAQLLDMSRPSVTTIFLKIRRRLAEESERSCPVSGMVEVDESYFGATRVRGKRGRGAAGKTIVFGVFKRDGCVYTEIVPDVTALTLQGIIRGRVALDSVIHSDGWRSYDGLVDVGYDKHLRVNHSSNQFADGANHINGIESFWSFAKRRLQKFNGIAKKTFYLHLKECEYRFNHRQQNLSKIISNLLLKNPL